MVKNATAKNVKELIRVLMPFIQGALEGLEDDEKVNWLLNDCEVLQKLFDQIVLDESAIFALSTELFWKNLDTSVFLLRSIKT